MSDRKPSSTTNLHRSGGREVPWSRVRDILTTGALSSDTPVFLSTVRPDGRPHSVGVGVAWYDGDLYVLTALRTRKARNLVQNPACTISTRLPGIDVVFEGDATLVIDEEALQVLAAIYRGMGFPAEVSDGAITAPFVDESAGPPPWHLFRIRFHTVFGVATEEPFGATRWMF
jgi:hypothetical protein